MTEFQSFSEIKRYSSFHVTITYKAHGSNACVYVYRNEAGELDLKCGKRTSWITPEQDNFGFAKFVYDNKAEFIEKLGEGRHFGEWVGPGINSTEGFKEKHFILFNWRRFITLDGYSPLPPRTLLIPVLYDGEYKEGIIEKTCEDLKASGSPLVPGFMNVEGVVIELPGCRYKKVFQAEETKWKGIKKDKPQKETMDYSQYLQPIRLEKLLSRDESYTKDYPSSIGRIVKDYIADLEKEGQIEGDEDRVAVIKKGMTGAVFAFIKALEVK